MRLPRAKESEVQAACLRALKAFGVFHWRNNTGSAKLIGKGGKIRPVRFGIPGAPDIMALHRGRFYGVECKRPLGPLGGSGGSEQTPEQHAFGNAITVSGGIYGVVRNVDELMELMELNRLDPAGEKGQ